MNIFVTGATGYLGSTLTSRLISEKEVSKITALARNQEKAHELSTRIKFRDKLEFARGDLRNHDFDLDKVNVVIHAAAAHDMDWIDKNIAEAIDVNIGGTLRLIEAVRRFKVQYFVYISSHSVYGKQDTMLVKENFLPRPNIVKTQIKYAAEVIVKSLAYSSIKFVILRPAHIYGVGVLPRWADFTVKFARLSCLGEDLTIYGSGNQKVDLVHVRDVSDCLYRILTSSENIWNETYNIGGGKAISLNELVETYIRVAAEMGLKGPNKIHVNEKSYTEKRGFRLSCLDISKIQAKLGWTPSRSIEEGIEEQIKANLDGLSNRPGH